MSEKSKDIIEVAEKHILYTLIFEDDDYDKKSEQQHYIFSNLTAEHFENLEYKKCFTSINHLFMKNKKINLIEIDAEFKRTETSMDTFDIINRIHSAFSTTAHFESSVDCLADSFKKKELYQYANNIIEVIKADGDLSEINNAVLNVPNFNNQNKDLTTEELMQLAADDLQKRLLNGDSLLGNKTYISSLDTLIGGIKDKELIMLTAEPNIGKSLLALQISLTTAMDKKKVAYFNFEMNEKSLGYRCIAMLTKTNIAKLNNPKFLIKKDQEKIENFNTDAVTENLFIFTNVKRNISDVVTKCKLFASKLDLVVVDYMQLVNGYGIDKVERVEMVCQTLKDLACELNCPVVAISSLNRQGDLRGSHQLDFDADQIWFMSRNHKSENSTDRAITKIEVKKNRDGRKGEIDLFFNEKYLLFQEIEIPEVN